MKIPLEIKQEAIWIVRGYDMRKRNYERMRSDILNHMTAGAGDGAPHGTGISDQTVQKAEQIEAYEQSRKEGAQ